MTTLEALELGITVALGILSIGLAAFAVWFSQRLNDRSSSALESVKALASETRSLVEANLSQQKDFSSRMLDSIIEQTKFGRNTDQDRVPSGKSVEEIVKERLDAAERRIASAVEHKIRTLIAAEDKDPAALQTALESIRTDIRKLTETASGVSAGFTLPNSLRSALEGFRAMPAHYVVLAGILKSSASSREELAPVAQDMTFPKGWEEGIENLIAKEVLEGSLDNIGVPELNREPLLAWLERNANLIDRLVEEYRVKVSGGVTDAERRIGEQFVI